MTSTARTRVRAVFLAALMVLSVVAISGAFAGSAAAQTTPTAVNGGGTALQDAIDNAGSGETIEVTDSASYDQIVIDRSADASGLTIQAANGESPTITHSEGDGTPTVAIDQDGITIEGFTIERTGSSGVAQAVRIAGDNVELVDNTYEVSSANDAAISVLTDSSGAAGNPSFSGTISDVSITGGEIITDDSTQSGLLVADSGNAGFGGDGSVSISGVTFTASADSTHVLELDTGGGVVDTAAALSGNTFDTAASPDSTTGQIQQTFDRDGLISSTIQGAIDGAESGATIEVVAGTYDESFDITKQVALEGPNAGIASDSNSRSSEAIVNLGSERIDIPENNDGVTIDGFSFTFENQGFYVRSDNVAIRNSQFELPDGQESNGYAIRFEGLTTGGIAEQNTFTGINTSTSNEFGNGIVVSGPDGHEIVGNTFTQNSIGVNVGNSQPAAKLKILNNRFTQQGDFAIALNHDDSASPSFNITGNQIESNALGVLVLAGGTIEINENDIVDNGVDANALSSDTVDATSNWWGDATGPSGEGPGTGASVSQNVEFDPWLSTNIDNDPANVTEFEVTIDDTNEPVEVGNDLEVEATVDNVGEGDDITQTLELLDVDGDVVDTQSVTLDNGTNTTESLRWDTDNIGTGDITVQTVTGDTVIDSDTEEVTVTEEDDDDAGSGSSGPPSTTEQTIDEDPDEPGTRVSISSGGLSAIVFSSEEVTGSTTATEYDELPSDAPPLDGDQPFVSAVEIEVPDDQTDQPATLEFQLSNEQLESADVDPEEDTIVVLRAADGADSYEVLDADVEQTENGISVTTETPGFSTFVISTDDASETEQVDDGEANESTDSDTESDDESSAETGDELPGFGALIALVALVGAALLAIRRTQN